MWGQHLDLDAAERTVSGYVGRIVGQRILIADVVGNLRADGLCVLGVFRKKGQAASGIGKLAQGGSGFLHGAA